MNGDRIELGWNEYILTKNCIYEFETISYNSLNINFNNLLIKGDLIEKGFSGYFYF